MKLETIGAKNLKGKKFCHTLAAINIITGANDKGKTAIANAVHLVLRGALPDAKTNPAIFAYSSGSSMSVYGATDTGLMIERQWAKKGQKVTLKEDGVDKLPETPLVLMDASEYFAASDTKRVQLAFSLINLSKTTHTKETIRAEVEAMEGSAPELANVFVSYPEDSTLQQWIDICIAAVANELGSAKKDVVRFAQTAQGIAALGLSETPVDPAAIAAQITAQRAEVEKLVKQKAGMDSAITEAKKTAQSLRDRHREAATLKAKLGDSATVKSPVADIEAALAEAQKRVAAGEARLETFQADLKKSETALEDLKELEVRIGEWKAQAAEIPKLQAAEAAAAELARDPADVEKTGNVQSTFLARIASIETRMQGEDRQILALKHKLLSAEKTPCCPECGTQGEEMKKAARAYFGNQIQEHEGALQRFSIEWDSVKPLLKTAQEAHNAEIEKQTVRQMQIRLGEKAAADLKAARAAEQSLQDAQARRKRLEAQATPPDAGTIAKDLEVDRKTAETIATQLERKRAAETLAMLGELDPIPNLEEMETECYGVECEIEEARATLKALLESEKGAQSQLADAKRLTQANDEREAAEARVGVLGSISKKLAEIRQTVVNDALAPLIETCALFTARILDSPLEMRDGEIGRMIGASWVPVRCFGGTHQAVTFAAIQAALGSSAPVPIVIVDEMGRMDATNKAQFLRNIKAAIDAGKLSQFIGIDVSPADYASVKKETGLQMIAV